MARVEPWPVMPRWYSGLMLYMSATSPTVYWPGTPVAVGLPAAAACADNVVGGLARRRLVTGSFEVWWGT